MEFKLTVLILAATLLTGFCGWMAYQEIFAGPPRASGPSNLVDSYALAYQMFGAAEPHRMVPGGSR